MSRDYRLLYIEDEESIRKEYVDYFGIFFDTIYEARDGIEGWEKYIKHKPDIIIADISMPKLDGLSLIKKIREGDKDTQVIMLTAHSDEEKLFTAIELNLVQYLLKPMSRKKIKEAFQKAFDNIQNNSESKIFFDTNISWDKTTSTLHENNTQISLSKQERLLLELLISRKNQAIDGFTIFNTVWEDDIDKEFDTTHIRTLVKKLRKKTTRWKYRKYLRWRI
jgi:DNA-binding response OmpR family regulator